MTNTPHTHVSELLKQRISAGDFPSAVYLVAERGDIVFADALGLSVKTDDVKLAANLATIYDLASLTKPLVTALLYARLLEQSQLKLDTPVKDVLPEFAHADKHQIDFRHLLTHTSGLPAWLPLYTLDTNSRLEARAEETLKLIAHEPLAYAPMSKVVYSDLGYITLGYALEKLGVMPLATLAAREIFAPLNLRRTFFNPPTELRPQIAASESNGNRYEHQMCEELSRAVDLSKDSSSENVVRDNLSNDTSETVAHEPHILNCDASRFRDRLIWGEVHDGNAHFLGGAAGHAGLFADVFDALTLAAQFLPSTSTLLLPETCRRFRENLTDGLNEARSVGWQLAATTLSTAGESLAPDSFGHTGFAGTSVWIDPRTQRIYILLTNRTHAHTLPFTNINSVRRRFHTLAHDALEAMTT